MNCDFVKNNILEHYKHLLSEEDARKFEEHLASCESCSEEMKRYRKYLDLLKRLDPGFEAPKDLLEELSDAMIKESEKSSEKVLGKKEMDSIKKALSSKTRKNKDSGSKTKFSLDKKVVAIILVLVTVVAGVYLYLNYDFSNAPWSVKTIKGTYSVDGLATTNQKLSEGENLLTEMGSEVIVTVPKSSKVIVKENSLVSIVQASDGKNILSLKQGSVHVLTESISPGLAIQTITSNLIDEGGEYDFSVDEDNSHRINVLEGLVVLEFNNIVTPIGGGYICEIKNGLILGVPFRKEASQLLKDELNNYLYENGGFTSLQKVLFEAREEDSITLWNLINRVDKNELLILYDKLNEIYPVPEGVTKKRVLGLNKEVLDLWWDEIEWQL